MLVDWLHWFLPAIARVWQGASPYADPGIFNPIWTFWLLLPVHFLPPSIATIAGFALPYVALVYVAVKFKKPSIIAIVGLSHPFLQLAWYGNIDWLILFGLVEINALMPFFLLIKPQASALIMASWVRGRTIRQLAILFVPAIVALLLNALFYPDWLGNMVSVTGRLNQTTNFSFFPYSLIIGLPLLYLAYRKNNALYGAIASLLCSPYFFMHSLVPAFVLLTVSHKRLAIALNLFFWIIFIGLAIKG
ncbi:MAG: hypothetical protein H0X30_15710 [Anaerolineae bacterium]|nr:hypothetical protein [Anaerolineae bacterium]